MENLENALKKARAEAMAEAEKLFEEFSAKHDARIAELKKEMEEGYQRIDALIAQHRDNKKVKGEIEALLSSMQS